MSKGGFIQLQISRTIKNPPPALRRRWVLDTDERLNDRPAPTPQGVRHHQALRTMRAVDMNEVSPSRASSVKRSPTSRYFPASASSFFLSWRVRSTNRRA